MQVLGPGDAFAIYLRISVVLGIILAMPVLLYQVWAFISPGLTPVERKTVRPWIPLALLFFALGVTVAYFILPYALTFLIGFTNDRLVADFAAGPYFDFVTTMFLVFGLIMEFPILLVGLSRVGIVTSDLLRQSAAHGHPRDRGLRRRRHAGRRPRQPARPRRDDVHPVRGDRLLHPAHRPVTERAGVGDGSESSAETAEPAVIILSGLSGGGKTAAAKLFEDLGYTVIDNLPGELLSDLAELVSSDRTRFAQVAIVMDVRAGDTMLALAAMRGALEGRGIRPRIVFLEARDEILIRRYSETRHAHPLGDQHGIASSIAAERSLLEPIRQEADIVIDTSDLSLRELRERLFTQLGTITDPDQLAIQLISFGFKYGLPLEADLVFDVRFMQNPYYVAELRQSSGLTEAVKTYVLEQPVAAQFLEFVESFLEFALPAYVSKGKSRLTIAIGCTGGYHRSIVIAEELATWLRERDFGPVAVFHRELDRA